MTNKYVEVVPGLYLTEEEFDRYIDGKYHASQTKDAKLGHNISNFTRIGDFLAQNIGKAKYRDYVTRHGSQLLGNKNQNKKLKKAMGIKDTWPPRRH